MLVLFFPDPAVFHRVLYVRSFDQAADVTFRFAFLLPFLKGSGEFVAVLLHLSNALVEFFKTALDDVAYLAAGIFAASFVNQSL